MVKYITTVAMTLSLFMPSLVWAAEFTASISRDQLVVGESLTLRLELSGTSAISKPSVSSLKKDFDVESRGQSSHTTIMNGNVSSSTIWTYNLTPKKEGHITIPSLSIKTSDGEISSQSVNVSVGKASSLPSVRQQKDIAVTANVSKNNPYKNEPIIYTATLITRHDMTDVKFSDLSMENAIVESVGEPRIYDKVQNGVAVKMLEVKYLITPLQPGSITVPVMVIQGDIPARESNSGSLFDDDLDPFGMFRNLNQFRSFGMTRLESFSVASNEIALEIRTPPAAGVEPWLPAASLIVTEEWDDKQTLKTGEPITRRFTISAEGILASQLPDLDIQGNEIEGFKVYADNPIMGNDVEDGKITSWRQENYTLIPQRSGTLTFPEISIAWWNVNTDKVAETTIPDRTLEILPGTERDTPPDEQQNFQSSEQMDNPPEKGLPASPLTQNNNRWLYAVIAGLLIILLLVLFWVISLQHRVTRLVETRENTLQNRQSEPKIRQVPTITNKELAKTASAEEIQSFLRRYGQEHWNTSGNASLGTLITAVKKQYPQYSREADLTLKALEDALYADKDIDIEKVKEYCTTLLTDTTRAERAAQRNVAEKLPDLNPS